jgi:hypothetical protein
MNKCLSVLRSSLPTKAIKLMSVCIVLFFMSGTSGAANEEWSLVRDSDGIKVWTRAVPNYPIHAFKAVTTINSSLSGLVNLVMDTEHASLWSYRTKKVNILKADHDKGIFILQVFMSFPWPLQDRDVVVEGWLTQDENTGIVSIKSRALPPGQYADNKNFMRMKSFEGDWVFRPLGRGRVEVTMLGQADPGGYIPASVINLIIHETPYQTLKGLQRVIDNPRYQSGSLPKIREPQP